MTINYPKLLAAIFGEVVEYAPPDAIWERVLGSLLTRERMVIEMRFGVVPMTLEKTGAELPHMNGEGKGVTRERAKQIETKALRRLRHPSRSRLLWPREIR